MSERMTGIQLRTVGHSGFAEWGLKTVPEMIAVIRQQAAYEMKWAQAVLEAKDEDFYVDTYKGVHVQREREVLQQGLPKPSPANGG